MTIDELYNIAHPIPPKLKYYNKYTFLAESGIIEAKYLDINDAITKNIPLSDYIKTRGVVLLFPNIVGGKMVDLYIRALDSKEFPLQLGTKTFPYNVGNLNPNFRYGDTIILVEGISDLGGLKLINPNFNVIAQQTSALSKVQAEMLSKLTNKFIIVTDNDKAGERGAFLNTKTLNKLGCHAVVVKQYSTLKDSGEVVDLFMQQLQNPTPDKLEKLKLIKNYYNMQIKLNGGIS